MALLSSKIGSVLQFGPFTLDTVSGELRRSGDLVKLPFQPAQVLALLARNSGSLVTREEIQREVWKEDTFVDFEHGINTCVKHIRVALGDSAEEPSYVETVPRRGYRFLVPWTSASLRPVECSGG